MNARRVFGLLILVLLAFWVIMKATSSIQSNQISAWVTYFGFPESLASYNKNAGYFREINPFIYAFDENGLIIKAGDFNETDLTRIQKKARQFKIKLIPTLVNDLTNTQTNPNTAVLKSPQIINRLITDDLSLNKHIDNILSIVDKNNFDGIEIDYENMNIKNKERFLFFIKKLYLRLHNLNKQLNLVLETDMVSGKRPIFSTLDLSSLSKNADVIKIMCYNLHGAFSEPGPIATIEWVKQTLIEAINNGLDKRKISAAIALHGFDWSVNGVKRLTYVKARELALRHSAKILRDNDRNPYFLYYEKGVKHTVWFEDAKSIFNKIKAINRLGIKKIAFWRLGEEDQNLYSRPPVTCSLR